MSTLKVQEIQHTGGTTGLTIDSGGQVALPQNQNITYFGFNTQTNITSTTPATLTTWTRYNNQTTYGFKQVGTAISESSGVFTASKLGVYKVIAEVHFFRDSSPSARYVRIDLMFRPNGQSYIGGDIYDNVPYSNSDTTYNVAHRVRYYNFNHTSDSLVLQAAASNNITIKGASAEHDTQLSFEWVAPPQS